MKLLKRRKQSTEVIIIDIFPPWEAECICCVCGEITMNKWGVPVDCSTALICSNDFAGEWASKPACEKCWLEHDSGGLVDHDPKY